ncbi:MAG: methylaspartate mutase accessory protein GlmL, partial [Defluviitaleaceae bacterium]|nr:methylaspartate mutase accessory protein GlmL [Defluviitaleaceae bacterium]
MNLLLCCDFGSTFTKLCVVDQSSGEIIASSKAFTTIESNVMDGYNSALDEIYKACGKRDFTMRLAASSAAGGLKMVASGLVPDLTAKASRLAAASAGAKVLKTFAYELTKEDTCEIESISPDIILLSGGIDGGNKDILLKNAESIAQIAGDFCVIVAGNRAAAHEAKELAIKGGKRAVVCENVMPQFGMLNIEPAKDTIRELFINNIISAKGLGQVQSIMSDEIIPTPLAVYEAAKLLSQGTDDEPGLGELMVYDLGGATTDVYSMADGLPASTNVYVQGLIEPFAKRTVEGDIGMRYSLLPMLEAIGESGLSHFCNSYGIQEADINNWQAICAATPDALPTGKHAAYKNVEHALAREAIRLSAARHAGSYERIYTPVGETLVQTGKDLTGVKYIIGTGGAIINAKSPNDILQAAIYNPQDTNLLKPQNPQLMLDKDYLFAAMGLLSRHFPGLALKIMKQKLVQIS